MAVLWKHLDSNLPHLGTCITRPCQTNDLPILLGNYNQHRLYRQIRVRYNSIFQSLNPHEIRNLILLGHFK